MEDVITLTQLGLDYRKLKRMMLTVEDAIMKYVGNVVFYGELECMVEEVQIEENQIILVPLEESVSLSPIILSFQEFEKRCC